MGKVEAATTVTAVLQASEAAVKRRTAFGVEMARLSFAGDGHQRGLPAVGTVRNFAENQEIYNAGDETALFFKLASGVVRTCTFLSDGRRQIDAFYVPGNVFGLEAGAEHGLSAETVCHSQVISYRRRDLEAFAAQSQGYSQQLFSYAMQSLARAQRHAVLLGRRSAVEKLAEFLIDWAAQSPESDVLTLEMPRRDIADYLGLTIETVSRAFAHLERKSLIELPTARQIRLKDPEGLRRLDC